MKTKEEIEKAAIEVERLAHVYLKENNHSIRDVWTAHMAFIAGHKSNENEFTREEVIKTLDWIGEMGWYREKGGRWRHDDETGYFESTEEIFDHYKYTNSQIY